MLSPALQKAHEAMRLKRESGESTKRKKVKHTIRAAKGLNKTVTVTLTRSLAIKAFCTECLAWGEQHPEDCTALLCPLFPFRGITRIAYGEQDDESSDDSEETDADSII